MCSSYCKCLFKVVLGAIFFALIIKDPNKSEEADENQAGGQVETKDETERPSSVGEEAARLKKMNIEKPPGQVRFES